MSTVISTGLFIAVIAAIVAGREYIRRRAQESRDERERHRREP